MNAAPIACETCGTAFVPRHRGGSHPTARFCSQPCAARARRVYRACSQCGTSYRVSKGGVKFCSQTCASLARTERQPFACLNCGMIARFHRSGVAQHKYCSLACKLADWRNRAHERAPALAAKRAAYRQRRDRARVRVFIDGTRVDISDLPQEWVQVGRMVKITRAELRATR